MGIITSSCHSIYINSPPSPWVRFPSSFFVSIFRCQHLSKETKRKWKKVVKVLNIFVVKKCNNLFLIIFTNVLIRRVFRITSQSSPEFSWSFYRERKVLPRPICQKKNNWIKFFVVSISLILKKFITINRWIIHAPFYRSWKRFVERILRPRFRLKKYKGKFESRWNWNCLF